ncbi:MAG TPA: endonuclease domain-containing protein [Xanthobacteraceae bacterium]|nr:endonuclease domain-containing protein [Xanthobacteraceae bacterium]
MTVEVLKKPVWRVKAETRRRARSLRTNSTRAEQIVWRTVRANRLNGVGFRRQTPIGPYIVDFASHSAKLIIELDGGQHYDTAHEVRDAKRDKFLRSKGFRVLRFSNHDVMTNLEGVWTVIAAAIDEAVAPSLPSPASGGGLANASSDVGTRPRIAEDSRR